jgi:hypothetical protein
VPAPARQLLLWPPPIEIGGCGIGGLINVARIDLGLLLQSSPDVTAHRTCGIHDRKLT